jgi:hypothetical protein
MQTTILLIIWGVPFMGVMVEGAQGALATTYEEWERHGKRMNRWLIALVIILIPTAVAPLLFGHPNPR